MRGYESGALLPPFSLNLIVRDQDCYEWAVGVLIPPAWGPHRPQRD